MVQRVSLPAVRAVISRRYSGYARLCDDRANSTGLMEIIIFHWCNIATAIITRCNVSNSSLASLISWRTH